MNTHCFGMELLLFRMYEQQNKITGHPGPSTTVEVGLIRDLGRLCTAEIDSTCDQRLVS